MDEGGHSKSHPDALIGVKESLTGQRWVTRSFDPYVAEAIADHHGLPLVLGHVLAARGVCPDAVQNFLNPSLKNDLPDPSSILDMDKAVARLCRALINAETITVFGDYDVDGATSTALLLRYLRAVGAKSNFYIPDRMIEDGVHHGK